MLFRHDDGAGFRRFADGVAVERLDGVHIDHARGNAFGFERIGGEQRLRDQQSVGDDGDVLAFRHLDRFADFELLIGGINDRRLEPAGADEHRADVRRGGAHQRLRGGFIGGRNHHEARQRTGERSLLDAHLRRAVFADGNAAVRAHHLQVRVSDRRRTRAAARSLCS